MAPRAQISENKKQQVKALADSMKQAKSLVFVNYSGMSVGVQQDLRAKLAEAGGKMLVAKNTLLALAAKEAGLPEPAYERTLLSEQTALVFSEDDAVLPIQILGNFAAEHEIPKIKAGVVDGQFHDSDGVVKISKLPGREELYGQVVGSVASPMYGLVGTLQGNLQKLIFILKEVSVNGS